MQTISWILLFTFLASIGSLLIAASFLLFPPDAQKKCTPSLVAFATGSMLASAFVGLIPEAIEALNAISLHSKNDQHLLHLHGENHKTLEILFTVLVGIFLFFCLEKFFKIHHCHNTECDSMKKETGTMILIGGSIHNFVDGILIAASFLVSFPLGVATAISILIHEIAHEIGDFAILIHSGYSKSKALFYNALSGITAVIGAVVGYLALHDIEYFIPHIMALAAASFIYIALVDLSPELHKRAKTSHSIQQLVFMIVGSGCIVFLLQYHQH